MGFSQQQLTILGGERYQENGLQPVAACNKFPPWVVLSCGALCCFLGYGLIWLAISQTVQNMPYWALCFCCAMYPRNPCGNVYSYHHLQKIAETAKRLGILVIADEVYGHLAFGRNNPFVPMGVFGSIALVLKLGSLSKRWLVPGWRLGWFVITDPSATFKKPKMIEALKRSLDIYGGPATFIQATVPHILKQNDKKIFKKMLNLLKQSVDICFEMMEEISCLYLNVQQLVSR